MLKDKVLIRKLKLGSKDAFCRIYEKYERDLLTLAVNILGETNAAEDVVQDVFISFVKSLENFHLRGSLKAYLTKCVANKCRDRIRKMQRHKESPLDKAEQPVSNADEPVQLVIRSEELQHLSRALVELPYEQREAIMLRLHGGLKFKAIAESQKVSIKTVQSRYKYGLIKLRSILDGEMKNETSK